MTDEQTERYYRQILLKEIGLDGQRRLMAAKVLVVGAGGLGSPAALYLAAAGVGQLGIVDFDVVDRTNLQRQILHTTGDIGRPKVQSAVERVTALNPDVEVWLRRSPDSSKAELVCYFSNRKKEMGAADDRHPTAPRRRKSRSWK